jgi:hypothetical protein
MLLSWINLVIFIAICLGVYYRRFHAFHITIMLSALLADLILLLIVELQNDAVRQAVETTGLLLGFHIAVSLIFLACYGLLIRTGFAKLKGKPAPLHRTYAFIFLFCRSMNCLTSFML